MNDEIDRYLSLLARRLSVPAEERDTILQEVRSHLEESVATALAEGKDQHEAERAAIQAFGDARRVAAQFSAFHRSQPVQWRPRGYLGGAALGAVALWGVWTLGTLPVYAYYFTAYPMYIFSPATSAYQRIYPTLASDIIQSTPICGGAFAAFTLLGWAWLTPLIALFCVAPFLWGQRADRWWAPALAYGVGAWLAAPWFPFFVASGDWVWGAEARMIALAVPIALIAASLGALWGRRQRARAAPIGAMRLA